MEFAKVGGYDNMSKDPYGIVDTFIEEYAGKNRPAEYLPQKAIDFANACDISVPLVARSNEQFIADRNDTNKQMVRLLADDLVKSSGLSPPEAVGKAQYMLFQSPQSYTLQKTYREKLANGKTTVFSTTNITPEQDAEYMRAVENGDTETARRMVEEAAVSSGAYTDDNGDVLFGYHAMDNDFTVFDRSKLGGVTDSNADSGLTAVTSHIGFWFNTNDLRGAMFSDKSIGSYFMFENPMSVYDLESLKYDILERTGTDADDLEDAFFEGDKDYLDRVGKEYSDALKEEGYDGIIVENDNEFGGKSIVVFDSSYAKSADTVTRDDSGNVIPLSERFNTDKDDIRYSTTGLLDANGNKVFTEEKLKSNAMSVLSMESVANLTGNEFSKETSNGLSLRDRVISHFGEGAKYLNKELGTVYVSKNSIRDDLNHGVTELKISSFAAVPQVIENGFVIDEDAKGKHQADRYVIAAPITISDEPYFMGVMVVRDVYDDNRLYIHEIITKKALDEKSISENTKLSHRNTTVSMGNDSQNRKSRSLYISDIIINALNVKAFDRGNDSVYKQSNTKIAPKPITAEEIMSIEPDDTYNYATGDLKKNPIPEVQKENPQPITADDVMNADSDVEYDYANGEEKKQTTPATKERPKPQEITAEEIMGIEPDAAYDGIEEYQRDPNAPLSDDGLGMIRKTIDATGMTGSDLYNAMVTEASEPDGQQASRLARSEGKVLQKEGERQKALSGSSATARKRKKGSSRGSFPFVVFGESLICPRRRCRRRCGRTRPRNRSPYRSRGTRHRTDR
ncbi:MAG: hypothetical protein Q4C53_04125 [Clostridia bacterium]|nr:hypothetical protein [Clostridia bacterium]